MEEDPTLEDLTKEVNFSNERRFVVGYVNQLNYEQDDDCIQVPCGFDFICYPIAGTSRAVQPPVFSRKDDGSSDTVSARVTLSDIQLSKTVLPVNGRISPWIDCDHPNKEFAQYSMEQLDSYELPNAEYLCIRSVVIEIKRRNNPNLIQILYKWLWKKSTSVCFWIIYPSNLDKIEGANEDDDIWMLWANFRQQLDNYSCDRLMVGIKFSDSLEREFIESSSFNRWKGEPLNIFWFDVNDVGGGGTVPFHEFFLNSFYTRNQTCLISCRTGSIPFGVLGQLRSLMANGIKHNSYGSLLDDLGIPFDEQFQLPLRPAEDNLSSLIYNTFEKHVHKYELYGKAILHAATDLFEDGICSSSKPPVVFVVGAGRGGLVKQVLKAESRLNEIRAVSTPKRWTVLAIEKNPFAALSLEASNFGNRVKVIRADARDFNKLQTLINEKADLIVSEMLGSFGCNELSPEILEFIERMFCHERTIMIPQSYASYIEPVHSLRMLQAVKSRQSSFYNRLQWQKSRDPDLEERLPTDQLYVVPMSRVYRPDTPKKCFVFSHPNSNQEYSCQAEFIFEINKTCDVTGFAGYFEVFLYKNHHFSTLPGVHHDAALSWFPIYLPVQESIRCPTGSQLKLDISRCTDVDGVWYEWRETVILDGRIVLASPIQNKDGKFDFIRLTNTSTE